MATVTTPSGQVLLNVTGAALDYYQGLANAGQQYVIDGRAPATSGPTYPAAPVYLSLFAINTPYAANARVVNPSGQIVQANVAFTSGSSYNAGDWTVVNDTGSGGGGGGAAIDDAGAASTSTVRSSQYLATQLGTKASALIPTAVKTGAYTAVVGDFVQADVSGGAYTVTLPAAPAVGALVSVKKVSTGSNVLTIAPAGGGTIDGDPTATTSTPFAGAVFEHVGSNVWRIVASMTTTGPAGPTGPPGTPGTPGVGSPGPTGPPGPGSLPEGRGKSATATLLSMPGIVPSGGFGGTTQSANRAAYFPRRIPTQITVDQIVFSVSSAVAGCNGRVAVYAATNDWQPTGAPLIDTGNVDCSTTGVKATTLTTPVVLPQGLYLAWANFSTGNPVTLGWPSWWPMIGYDNTSGGSISQIYAAQTFGAPPSTPLAWDSTSSGGQPSEFIFFRESVA